MYDRRDPDYYDAEPIDYDELADLKALHDEEEWRERRYGIETMEDDV